MARPEKMNVETASTTMVFQECFRRTGQRNKMVFRWKEFKQRTDREMTFCDGSD
jgi:hypothetical protein